MLQPGDIIDRYEVEAHIGEGGMASVYRVRHALLGSLAAMKVLRADLVRDDDIRQRFFSEGRIQAQLHHPYIAAVTDLVSVEGVAGLIMEYLEGGTLADRIDDGGPLSMAETVAIFSPVLAAVEHAHVHGVVHRDLKPSNVFLCSRTTGMVRPVVLDFGIAKLKLDSAVTAFRSRETHASARMGTVHYMSPEQVRSAATVDAASDVYSLGVMLVEALTGELIHTGENDFDVMRCIVEGERRSSKELLGPDKQGMLAVVERALARDPGDRYADCGAFRRALESAVDTRAPKVAPVRAKPTRASAGATWPGARGPAGKAAPPQSPAVVRPVAQPKAPVPVVSSASKVHGVLRKMPGTDYEERFDLTASRVCIDEARGQVLQDGRDLGRQTHAVLERRRDGWTIMARGSGRVVEVDRELVRGVRFLDGGETIFVGIHVFRFEC